MPRTKFRSPYPRRLHIKYGFDRASGFGEDVEIVNDDGRRTEEVSYKLTYEPLAQVS